MSLTISGVTAGLASSAKVNKLSSRNGSIPSISALPVVLASTYLGGPGFEITWACAVDSAGNVYIAGDAQEAGFPVTSNALQKTYGDGGQDGFVAKYDRSGNLLWSTFLGGSGWDGVFGLTVDAAGNAVVTGVTESTDFPVTANAVQATLPGGDAAFVTVISADGTRVIYSTYLGARNRMAYRYPLTRFMFYLQATWRLLASRLP